jgi:uncharacterized protein (DUF433 family)
VTVNALVRAASSGCYDATRAAALSGVPKSIVYWWASHDVVVPSVSPSQEKLWSYSDLMALRIVSWLRHPKSLRDSGPLPASPMPQVRRALALLDAAGMDLWRRDQVAGSPVLVDGRGQVFVRVDDQILNLHSQPVLLPVDALMLTEPFREAGGDGPDLLQPRPHLRIVPDKVSGEPHVEHSRVTTQTLAALAVRGCAAAAIANMYDLSPDAVAEALDMERQLTGDTAAA